MDLLIAPGTVAAGQADTAPATGTPGWATDGNPATNTPATQWPAYAFNALQAELVAVIQAAGLTLDRNNNGQLLAALQATSATVSGLIKIATTALAQGLTDDTTALTPKKLSDAFKGANQSFATSGFQKLPGGLILQWGTGASTSGANPNAIVTFPVAFPNACLSIQATVLGTGLGIYTVQPPASGALSKTSAAFTCGSSSTPTTGIGFYWFAIGE